MIPLGLPARSEEYKVAASSIADAMQALQQYYASGAFVQARAGAEGRVSKGRSCCFR